MHTAFVSHRGILHRQFLDDNFSSIKNLSSGILHRQFLGDRKRPIRLKGGGILHRQFLGDQVEFT